MANKIVELLNNDELRYKLGQNAKEKSKEYLIDNIKLKWIEILK